MTNLSPEDILWAIVSRNLTVQQNLRIYAGFDVSHVEQHGDGYKAHLLTWPRHNGKLLKTQGALEKRVAKAGYELRGYSDKPDDRFVIVSEK